MQLNTISAVIKLYIIKMDVKQEEEMLSIDAGCLLSFQKAHLIISLGVRKLSFVRISAINIRNTFSERAKSTVCPLSAYNNICACSS